MKPAFTMRISGVFAPHAGWSALVGIGRVAGQFGPVSRLDVARRAVLALDARAEFAPVPAGRRVRPTFWVGPAWTAAEYLDRAAPEAWLRDAIQRADGWTLIPAENDPTAIIPRPDHR